MFSMITVNLGSDHMAFCVTVGGSNAAKQDKTKLPGLVLLSSAGLRRRSQNELDESNRIISRNPKWFRLLFPLWCVRSAAGESGQRCLETGYGW